MDMKVKFVISTFIFHIFPSGADVNQMNKKKQTPLYSAIDLRTKISVSYEINMLKSVKL